MFKIFIKIGIIIVNITKIISIFSALFFNLFWFWFNIIENKYWTKFIILELKILYTLVSINPAIAEKEAVKSSGVDVANPAIFPRCLWR